METTPDKEEQILKFVESLIKRDLTVRERNNLYNIIPKSPDPSKRYDEEDLRKAHLYGVLYAKLNESNGYNVNKLIYYPRGERPDIR
jgi:hypothetical protein